MATIIRPLPQQISAPNNMMDSIVTSVGDHLDRRVIVDGVHHTVPPVEPPIPMGESRKEAFRCAECKKICRGKKELYRHGCSLPYQCSFPGCGKRCRSSFGLTNHEKIHDAYLSKRKRKIAKEEDDSSDEESEIPVSQNWSEDQVLERLNSSLPFFDKYREIWKDNAIDGRLLAEINDDVLQSEIKVGKKLHRIRMLREIGKIRQEMRDSGGLSEDEDVPLMELRKRKRFKKPNCAPEIIGDVDQFVQFDDEHQVGLEFGAPGFQTDFRPKALKKYSACMHCWRTHSKCDQPLPCSRCRRLNRPCIPRYPIQSLGDRSPERELAMPPPPPPPPPGGPPHNLHSSQSSGVGTSGSSGPHNIMPFQPLQPFSMNFPMQSSSVVNDVDSVMRLGMVNPNQPAPPPQPHGPGPVGVPGQVVVSGTISGNEASTISNSNMISGTAQHNVDMSQQSAIPRSVTATIVGNTNGSQQMDIQKHDPQHVERVAA